MTQILLVSSNDPVDPDSGTIPAQLSVTGTADIWADPYPADFGEIYVNYAGPGNYGGTLELTLGNDGTDTLNISSITVDNTAFSRFHNLKQILIMTRRIILDVTFMTTDVGTDSGTITIVV